MKKTFLVAWMLAACLVNGMMMREMVGPGYGPSAFAAIAAVACWNCLGLNAAIEASEQMAILKELGRVALKGLGYAWFALLAAVLVVGFLEDPTPLGTKLALLGGVFAFSLLTAGAAFAIGRGRL